LYRHLLFMFMTSTLILFATSTFAQEKSLDNNLVDGCVADYDEAVDYFPDKIEVTDATGFAVEYFNNYKVVSLLTPWQNAETTFTYVLVQCGTPVPDDIEADQIIEVPVQRTVTMSTTILPHLSTQDIVDRLVAVDTLLFASTAEVLAFSEETELPQVGGGGSGDVNIERLLALAPDMIMTQQFSATGSELGLLQDAGLSVVLNGDFADVSPLAQAEWGKYIALYFNTEAAANEAYAAVRNRYMELDALTDDIPIEERPTVIAATPFQGTWFMPGGDSTVAQLIDDAGGNFLWSDIDGSSVALDFETVFERGADADMWVNLNAFWLSAQEMLAEDARFADFAAFQNGTVWNNNLQQNANGGNNYFENGAANPHLLLEDLIAILHPDLLPEHEFQFYRRLQTETLSE